MSHRIAADLRAARFPSKAGSDCVLGCSTTICLSKGGRFSQWPVTMRSEGRKSIHRTRRRMPAGYPTLRVLPLRPIQGRWPRLLQRQFGRYFRVDPAAIVNGKATPDEFRAAMGVLRVGETFKITAATRHPESDALLLNNVDLFGASIVDIGASDGSTSLDLLRRLPPFKSYVIADLYMNIYATRIFGHTVICDPDGACILVFGARCVAWPRLSRAVRFLYWPVIAGAARHIERRREITLLNPAIRSLMAVDRRITSRVHDVFHTWPDDPPDVIKVANLLRRIYFSDDAIRRALDALLASLPQGGHLLIVDNPYIKEINSRAGLYRRDGDRFVTVALTDEAPEINDLVLRGQPRQLGRQEVS